MNRQILIIKTGSTIQPLLNTGVDFEHWFATGLGLELDALLVSALHLQQPLPDMEQVLGIIITGSAAYVTDEEDWNFTGADYLRLAQEQGVPVLGVCYGHQLLAWTFGGRVAFSAGGREIGTSEIRLTGEGTADVLLGELPNPFLGQVSHLQSVTELPPEAVLLAESDFDANHGFRLGESIWGVQFHPEFTATTVRAYIEDRRDTIAGEGLDPDALLASVRETPECAALLRRFMKLARERRA